VKAPKEKKGKKAKEAAEGTEVSSDEVAAASAVEDDDDTDFVVASPDAGVSTGELSVVEGAFTEDDLPAIGAVSDPNIDVFEDDTLEDFGGIDVEDDEENA
jgi:hypothetical protein